MKKQTAFRRITAFVISIMLLATTVMSAPMQVSSVETIYEDEYGYSAGTAVIAEDIPYTVLIGDILVTNENASDILGDGSIMFDVGTNTLRLKNADITAAYGDGYTYASAIRVSGADEFVIEFEGNNTVTVPDQTDHQIAGISADCSSLILRGKTDNDEENVLTINAGSSLEYQEGSYGIKSFGDIIIESGTINANGGNAPFYGSGISTDSHILYIAGGIVNAVGGKVSNGSSNGIEAGEVIIANDAVVNATGGESTSTGSYGIRTYGDITIKGTSVVTATGGKGSFDGSKGLSLFMGNLYVQDSAVVTAVGTQAEGDGLGCGVSLSDYSKSEEGGLVSWHGYDLVLDSGVTFVAEGKDLAVRLYKPVFDDPDGYNDHPNSTAGNVTIEGEGSYTLSTVSTAATPANPDSISDVDWWDTVKFSMTQSVSYKVSFDANGGVAIEPVTVTHGEKYGRLPSSSVKGLSGGDSNWYLVADDGTVTDTKITRMSVVETEKDHKLFVKRKVLNPTLNITLTVPGGISDGYQYYIPENSTRVLTVTVNNRNDEILDYTYEWYKDGVLIDGETQSVLTLDGNVSDSGGYTVKVTALLKDGTDIIVTENSASAEKAQNVKILHMTNTLYYDANGGEGGPVSNYTGGERITVSSAEPTRDGYIFDGWNTSADGSGEEYNGDNEYIFQNDNGNGGCTTTLYAQWKKPMNTVTFETNGGSHIEDAECENGGTVDKPSNPKKSGYTFKGWYIDSDLKNKYDFDMPVTEDITLYAKWTKKSSGGGGGGMAVTKYTLTYETNSGDTVESRQYRYGETAYLSEEPEKEGFLFDGWYLEKELETQMTEVVMTKNTTVYAKWIEVEKEENNVPSELDGEKHTAYIFGYPDKTVRPNNNITRGEVAVIFYRLLKDEVRQSNLTKTNSFNDVDAAAWYNTEVSTLSKLGIVEGRADDIFAPDAYITRAEFAAICARFDENDTELTEKFSDISGHWAEKEILKAASKGWIEGYGNNSFRPDSFITRAEAVTMINRVLCRTPGSADCLHEDMISWSDNSDVFSWYYIAIQEASNSHEYTVTEQDGEVWTDVTNE